MMVFAFLQPIVVVVDRPSFSLIRSLFGVNACVFFLTDWTQACRRVQMNREKKLPFISQRERESEIEVKNQKRKQVMSSILAHLRKKTVSAGYHCWKMFTSCAQSAMYFAQYHARVRKGMQIIRKNLALLPPRCVLPIYSLFAAAVVAVLYFFAQSAVALFKCARSRVLIELGLLLLLLVILLMAFSTFFALIKVRMAAHFAERAHFIQAFYFRKTNEKRVWLPKFPH